MAQMWVHKELFVSENALQRSTRPRGYVKITMELRDKKF